LIGVNTFLAFVNALFLGAGAKVWGNPNLLWYGLITAALIVPVFAYRHYVQDDGKFPPQALLDLDIKGGELGERREGIWPYVALLAGAGLVVASHYIFQL
jgi:hypothetical protein